MEVKKIETTEDYLQNLKIKGRTMFSQDELDFFSVNCKCSIYEFTQETKTETDADFYHNFVAWLKETDVEGYVYFYIVAGMRKGELMTNEELEYIEKNVMPCFDLGYGWIIQTNHEVRFKRRLKLIMFERKGWFHKLIDRSK